MQVFEDKHQRLIEALAQKDALNRILGATPADLRIHLRKRIVALDDTEQCEQMRHGVVLEVGVENRYLARNLFPPSARVIVGVMRK
jgi:hypothetical protein